MTSDVQPFPLQQAKAIGRYLPGDNQPFHVTLTYAASIDSGIALSPGVQTVLSGPESKSMTHFLRSRHDAILIGAGTAIADGPSLMCRLPNLDELEFNSAMSKHSQFSPQGDLTYQPMPVVIDPNARWKAGPSSRLLRNARQGIGRAVQIFTCLPLESVPKDQMDTVREAGGSYIHIPPRNSSPAMAWTDIFQKIHELGAASVMIEGGATVINDLLTSRHQHLISSVIVTIAPVWLGSASINVAPDRKSEQGLEVARLHDVQWIVCGADAVLCGQFQ